MLQHWASKGEFYICGFVLLIFIELVRLALNELAQYKTAYVELAFARPMLFSSFKYSLICLLTVKEPVMFARCVLMPFFLCTFTGGPLEPERMTNCEQSKPP